jgi:hypothetical protein
MDAILVPKSKALTHFTDEELEQHLHEMTKDGYIVYSYVDVLGEMNRRADEKRTAANITLTKWIVVATVVAAFSALVSAVAAIVALLK